MKQTSERFIPSGDYKSSFYLEHIGRYRFAKKYVVGKKVLDLGCGMGYGAAELKKIGAKEVVGVDNDPEAIEFAKGFAGKKVRFLKADATALLFPDQEFDVVVSFEVIEHIKDYQQYLKEAFRVLKLGGYLIFSTPNRLQYRQGTSHYHYREFTAMELTKLLLNMGYSVKIFGQSFSNQLFVQKEREYFKRYTLFSIGGNRVVKRLFGLIPSSFKTVIYHRLWGRLPTITPEELKISGQDIKDSVTLIGISRNRRMPGVNNNRPR